MSTTDQSQDAQLDALKELGAGCVFFETISGPAAKRPALQRMLDQFRDGDVVAIPKYDHHTRFLRDFLDIEKAIKGRGAVLQALVEGIDTTTPAGEPIFHVFASLVHLERRILSERTQKFWLFLMFVISPTLVVQFDFYCMIGLWSIWTMVSGAGGR